MPKPSLAALVIMGSLGQGNSIPMITMRDVPGSGARRLLPVVPGWCWARRLLK
jgi:hypothetical protein